MAVAGAGQEARTRYEVVRRVRPSPSRSPLLACRLETGRTHQIRVHLAAIGHPVVGDGRYGGDRQSLPMPGRSCTPSELGFDHPVTGEPLAFDVAAARRPRAVLAALHCPGPRPTRRVGSASVEAVGRLDAGQSRSPCAMGRCRPA